MNTPLIHAPPLNLKYVISKFSCNIFKKNNI